MPRKRAMGVASSSEQSVSREEDFSAATASPIVDSNADTRASSEEAKEEFYEAESGLVGTTMDLEESVTPAYNTRGAKRVRGDTLVSLSPARRSKRHEARRAASGSPTGETNPLLQGQPSSRTNASSSRAPTPGPLNPTARLSRRLRNTITEDTDVEDSDSSSLSSPPASLATGVSHRSSTRTTFSAQNGDESPEDQSSHAVISNIKRALAEIPIGEIAYGRLLPMDPSPEISIKGVGPIKLPLSDNQLVAIRNKAHKPFEGKFGSDWPFNSANRLTPIIYDDEFEIEKHLEYIDGDTWGNYVSSLVSDVAAYLGYGSEAAIQALPRSLCLWEKGSIWRNYTK